MEEFPLVDISQEVMFEETLLLTDAEGETLAEVVAAVEPAGANLAVYMYSSDGQLRVRSVVTRALTTASEVRLGGGGGGGEELLRLTDDGDEYQLFRTCSRGEPARDKQNIPKSSMPLILEGANLVFLRHVTINGLSGRWVARTVSNEAKLIECEYEVETEGGEVTVTRVVGEETMTTRLMGNGRILWHRWAKSGRRLVPSQPQGAPEDEGMTALESASANKPQLAADQPAYWERKDILLQDMRRYLDDHPDLQDLIADLIKEVLFEKPDNPINFADLYISEMLGIERLDCNNDELSTNNTDDD